MNVSKLLYIVLCSMFLMKVYAYIKEKFETDFYARNNLITSRRRFTAILRMCFFTE